MRATNATHHGRATFRQRRTGETFSPDRQTGSELPPVTTNAFLVDSVARLPFSSVIQEQGRGRAERDQYRRFNRFCRVRIRMPPRAWGAMSPTAAWTVNRNRSSATVGKRDDQADSLSPIIARACQPIIRREVSDDRATGKKDARSKWSGIDERDHLLVQQFAIPGRALDLFQLSLQPLPIGVLMLHRQTGQHERVVVAMLVD